MAVSLSDWSHVTEKIYKTTIDETEVVQSPFFKMLNKQGGWTGDDTFNFSVIWGSGQGTGADYTQAKANASAHSGSRFAISSKEMYGYCTLQDKLIAFAKSPGAPVEAITFEVDRVRRQMFRDYSTQIYGMGGSARGKVSAINSNTVTLTNPTDAVRFHKGMVVKSSANEDGTGIEAGTSTVSAVSLKAGKVTFTSIHANISVNDYLFRDGDQNDVITGLGSPYSTTSTKGWLPCADPTSGDNHFGVDRSVAVEQLAGWRVDATAGGTLSAHEGLMEAGAWAATLGAQVDAIFANPQTVNDFLKGRDSKVIRDEGGEITVGFTGMRAILASGTAKIYSDPFCPRNRFYGLQMNTWHLLHANDTLLDFMKRDGLIWRIDGTNYYSQLVSYAQLYCQEPGMNFVVLV